MTLVERGHELAPLSILTHRWIRAAAIESVYFARCRRDSSTAEHQLRLLKTGVRLLHSAPVRGEANGPLLQHISLILWKRAYGVSKEKPRCRGRRWPLETKRPRGPKGDGPCAPTPPRIYPFAIKKLSSFFPDLMASRSQCGCRPRPAQVCDGSFGLRYFGATSPRVPRPCAVPRVPRGS
jgi:hypothetical protein